MIHLMSNFFNLKKSGLFLLMTALVISPNIARADYQIITKASQIQSEIQEKDWVFFDIDDTLIRYHYGYYPYLMDLNVLKLMQEFRAEKVKFLALTARTADQGFTHFELKSVGIHLDPYCESEVYFTGKYSVERGTVPPVLCHQGILFTGNETSKGDLLAQFMIYLKNQGASLPRRIIFVDDRKDNLRSVGSIKSLLKVIGIESVVLFHIQAPK
jgi:hypothetical protein